MGYRLITPAAGYPVTVDEAKAWARVDGDASDGVFDMLIAAATGAVQDFTGRQLVSQVWELSLDAFSPSIELTRGPVTAVNAVRYFAPDGLEQTLDPSVYSLDLVSDPQWIVINAEAAWPEVLDAINAVTIRFTTGFDEQFEPLKSIIAALVTKWHDDRDDMVIPPGVQERLRPYRRIVI